MTGIQTSVLLEGAARGELLRLTADVSFWGGVDPRSGLIIDSRHPQYGQCVAGKILMMHRSIGSSSGSSILLELFQRQRAPAGIILAEPDFIIVLGVVVAREMGFGDIPVVKLDPGVFDDVPGCLTIDACGQLTAARSDSLK